MKKSTYGTCIAVWIAMLGRILSADDPSAVISEDFDTTWQAARWQFSNGAEFPGAQGSFSRSPDAARRGEFGGRLQFDFNAGGNYVAAYLQLKDVSEVAAIRVWLRKPRGNELTVRYSDQTNQTFQKGVWAPDDRWVSLLIPLTDWTGHWGGSGDGRVHGPPKQIGLLVENTGVKQGALLFDDLELIPGTPGKTPGSHTAEYSAARFATEEGWRLGVHGPGGSSSLNGRTLRFDFSQGAASVGIVPAEFSLLGNPEQIRIRVKGSAPGHPVRLLIATHFMTFEKTIGEFRGDEISEIVVDAPPGAGWRWYGGENDGKRHGPLRIRGIYLDAGDERDSGTLELQEIRVSASCAANRCCVLTADVRQHDDTREFVAEIRSLLSEAAEGSLQCNVRDWSGAVVARHTKTLEIAGGGAPCEVTYAVPEGDFPFLEAEFVLELKDQLVPAARTCYTAPIERRGSRGLDSSSPFGMGLYLYRFGNDPQSLETMDRMARMAANAGVKWSREEFSWARIETRKGQYDWSFYDNLVKTANRHGISVYGLLAYWSRWTEPYTPQGIDDYCRFAAAAAERYRGVIRHWEVYNEPNIFFWQGPRDMYAELLKKAYTAIKKANPEAEVLGCSTAGIDTKFIKRTIKLGAPFDSLTIHPYRRNLDDRAFVQELQKASEIAKNADGTVRPVWITEMGWGTHTHHNGAQAGFSVTTQREQACLIARTYVDAIASGVVANTCWYDFRNDGYDPFNFEHNMGIVTRDFRPKPAYRAYATVARLLQGKSIDRELNLGDDVIAYRFASDDGAESAVAVWTILDSQTVQLPIAEPASVINLMGESQTVKPARGKIILALERETPVFVSKERR